MGRLQKSAESQSGGGNGLLVGQLMPTGHIPTFIQEISDHKLPFTAAKFISKR